MCWMFKILDVNELTMSDDRATEANKIATRKRPWQTQNP